MSVPSVFYLDKIILPGSVEIQTLGNATLDAGIQSLIEHGAGEVAPNFIATQTQKPKINFATMALDTILSNISVQGSALASATFYAKMGATGGRVARATTSHYKIAATAAHIYWTTIRLPHNGVAEADVVITPIYDGTNSPFAYTGSVALSGTMSSQSFFRAGPIVINGTTIDSVQEITVNSGGQIIEVGSDGEVYSTFVGTQECNPTIEVRTFKAVNWSDIGLNGLALDGSTGLVAYGRKYSPDGAMVAAGTAEHVSFSALYGRVVPLNTQGNKTDILSDHFRIECRYDAGSGLPLVVNGATAISAGT